MPGPLDIHDFGARTDAASNTRAIQAALDHAARSGGGTVCVSSGAYVTGSLRLPSGVELHLAHGARLLGSTDLAEYPPLPPAFHTHIKNYAWKSLLWAQDASHLALTGPGTIDGRGGDPAFAVARDQFWTRVENRPHVLYLHRCADVRIEDVTLRDSAFWMAHLTECSRLRLHRLTIHNHAHFNNDGLDLDGCSDVLIDACHIDTCDDAICFKSMTPALNRDIVITNSILRSHYNALKIGTESATGLCGLAVSNCRLGGSAFPNHIMQRGTRCRSALSFMTCDGADVQGITVTNCHIADVKAPLFLRRQTRHRAYWPGMVPDHPPGLLRDISISHLTITDTTLPAVITGVPGYPVENVRLHDWWAECPGNAAPRSYDPIPDKDGAYPDCDMFGEQLPAYGLLVRHAHRVRLADLHFRPLAPDARPLLFTEFATELSAERVT